ncbi:hypothetical protein [Streptomyces sp. NPDC013455]|uniref:hypothetical protein n=1 Tax=Streptomyces sp. NPDC013455 TaxID=3155605 RepID=UPI0033CBC620
MTDAQHSPRVLSLYPRRYRASHGAEILQTYLDPTEGASASARLREQLDVAAHAVRVRTGTGGSRPAGRFLLTAAPYALASAGSIAATGLTEAVAHAVRSESTTGFPLLGAAVSVLVLAAAALACTGRWASARGLGAVSLVALLGAQLRDRRGERGDEPVDARDIQPDGASHPLGEQKSFCMSTTISAVRARSRVANRGQHPWTGTQIGS